MSGRTLQLWRGDGTGGELVEYEIEAVTGMVVLDAVLEVQRSQAKDLAVPWNCKAAKCGSCSAEINGLPRLMCKTRLDHLPEDEPIRVEPIKAFPIIRDLVTDVSWNYEVNKRIPPFTPKEDGTDTDWLIGQEDVDRMSEYRKCIECFLCQDVCHILRDHRLHDRYFGPRFLVRIASLETHPLDTSTVLTSWSTKAVSASATSRSAAPRSAPRASTSPTTRSSRSRSASSTAATTPWRSSCAGSAGGGTE